MLEVIEVQIFYQNVDTHLDIEIWFAHEMVGGFCSLQIMLYSQSSFLFFFINI